MTKITTLPSSVEVIERLDLNIPRSWNDLTKKQLLKACELFIKPRIREDYLVNAVFSILDIRLLSYYRTKENNLYVLKQKGKKKKIVLDADKVRFICSHFDFLLQESDLMLTRMPVIRYRMKNYYGPDMKLYNVSYDEYRTAENYFLAYNKTRKQEYLDLLFATFYREKNKKISMTSGDYEGDLRKPFNAYTVEYRARKLRKVKMKYKLVVFQYFAGCLLHLQEMFPKVFEPGTGGGIQNRVYQSLKMVDYLNNGDVTKNKKIVEANIYEVMTRMQTEREKIEQIEKIGKH